MISPSRYVWDRVAVNGLVLNGTTIYWYLDYRFNGIDPWVFKIQWAPQQSGPWEDLATTSENYYVDNIRRRYGKFIDSYYRIILTDGNNYEYISPIASERGVWSRRDYILAKEIARKEYLLQSKFVGRDGYLLKRYKIGNECTACLDFDTHQPTNANCLVCFGTGLVGGYAPSIRMLVTADNFTTGTILRDNLDQEGQVRVNGRVVGFTDLMTGDVWVDANTDERYAIKSVSLIAGIKGKAVVNLVELRLVPNTDIIYSIPACNWGGSPAGS